MPLHFLQPPAASVTALDAALPRIANRASVATHASRISAAVDLHLRRRPGAPPPAAPEPIAAPVHVLGLDQIVAHHDIRTTPVKLWTHMLHDEDDDAPVALADIDAHSQTFSAVTEGAHIAALGKRIRAVETENRTSAKNYDLAMIRVPALSLSALWLKGRDGEPDVVIPEESPMSPLTAGKHYTLDEFNAALKPAADRLLKETDPDKGG